MVSGSNNQNILDTAVYNFEQAAKRLRLDDALFNRFLNPKEMVEVTLNPILPDGSVAHLKAFIVRHSDSLGPAKGGIRMSPVVTIEDITGLAMEMTWKTALIGVPFGGGKSGICADPSSVSADAKEAIIRSFVRGGKRHIGPEIYIPAPDMGTNQEDMGHIRDCISYSQGTSITSGCYVTGKPVVLGGIVGRKEATGKGVVYAIMAGCRAIGIDISETKAAVQGFGNVASVAAAGLVDLGVKIIAISDVRGGVYKEDGFDIPKLTEYFNSTGSLSGFDGADAITNEELLCCDCDLLVPAATQSQITSINADKIKAKLVAEGANAPTTPDADEILNDKGVFVIPDILCNAGGVFVSYLEYTQETQREQMTLEQVENRLSGRMDEKFNAVYEYSKDKNSCMRDAAMDIAVRNAVEAVNARGLLP